MYLFLTFSDVRRGLRGDVMVNDAVKRAIAERADNMKMLDSRPRSNSVPRSLNGIFEYMINGNCTDHVVDKHENN